MIEPFKVLRDRYRVWRVWDRTLQEISCFVTASHVAQAKHLAQIREESGSLQDSDWTDLRAVREARFDLGLTEQALINAGIFYAECRGCYARIEPVPSRGDQPYIGMVLQTQELPWYDQHGFAWCSAECYERHPGRRPERRDWICIYYCD